MAGALVAGLWLIPSFQNASSLHATAAALCALSTLYFIVWGRRWVVRMVAAGIAVAICIGGNQAIKPLTRGVYEQWTELERRNSPFGLMQILQSKLTPQRALINDFLMQNSYDPQTRHSLLAFSYMEHGLARAYHTNANSVLVIGMGVGIVPGAFAEEGARVDTVEINPAYVDLGVKYFDLDTNKFRIFIEDGRYFMRRSQSRYDLVIMDAFLGDSPPSHLMTRESFESARQLLNSDGLFVLNSFGDFDLAPDPFFLASMHKTLAAVFRTVKIHSTGNGNVFFVASMRETLEMQQRPSLRKVHATKVPEVRKGYANMITTDPAHGMVLTDDYNPVEVRDARNRERIRRAMAEAVRKF
ncbi:MAG: hypothetical protein FJ405_19195 [Verrucomicrobia bacterium]|nr:hypothetical protein [Verrucomicrobiota bacterium]